MLSFRDVKTIAFLPHDFGEENGTYIIHKHSMASIDTLRYVFYWFAIRTTTKPMTEVCFLALFELAFHRHKKDLYNCIRGLLEVGDSRNGNKDYVYFKCLCAIIKRKIRGKNRHLDFIKKVEDSLWEWILFESQVYWVVSLRVQRNQINETKYLFAQGVN